MRKAQSEVITTVLIILLVLAAVFIVWTAVKGMINKSTTTATQKASCMDVSLTLSDVACAATTHAVTATISRGSDSVADASVKFKPIVGTTVGAVANAPTALGSATSVAMGAGVVGSNVVKIAPVLDGVVCDPVETATVTCA